MQVRQDKRRGAVVDMRLAEAAGNPEKNTMVLNQVLAVVDTKKHPKGQIQIQNDPARSQIRVVFTTEVSENEQPAPLNK